jgi:hypothetical protein
MLPVTLLFVLSVLLHDLFLAFIVVVLAVTVLAQKAGIGLHRPMITSNMEPLRPRQALVPISRPAMPNEWKVLASLPRPRAVYMTIGSTLEMIFSTSLFVGLVAFATYSYWHEFKDLTKHIQNSIFVLLWFAFLIYLVIVEAREWSRAREILRDGVLTTGILTDWNEGRHGPSITYQFWTSSGQRFENRGTVKSKEELAVKEAPLKIFYLPQNPTKNVALACTSLRLKTS